MPGPVERMLDILDLLGSGKSMTVDEIASALGLPASSAYRLLRTLRERHVVFQPAGEAVFHIGFAVLKWADGARQSLDLVGLARPSLQLLADRTQETTTLTLLHGAAGATADVIEGQGHIRVAPDRGRVLPLHSGASCKAILAFLPAEFLPRSGETRAGRGRGKSLAVLKADLKATRERGYALSLEEVYEGAAAVAAPIFVAGSKVVGSLAVSAPLSRFNDKRVIEIARLLKGEADRLNALLGSIPPPPARPRVRRANRSPSLN